MAAGLIGRHGDNATHSQHNAASGLLCTPAMSDSNYLTEDDATHTSGSTGLRDLSRMNSFITGTYERHVLPRTTDRHAAFVIWNSVCT